MIELVETKNPKNPKSSFQLLINGEVVSAKIRNFKRDDKIFININANDLDAARKISNYKFRHFPNLYYLTMPLKIKGCEYLERIYIVHNHVTGQFELKFRYKFDLKEWKTRAEYLRFYGSYLRFITELNYAGSEITKGFKEINLKPQIKSLSHKNLGFEVSFVVLSFYEKLSDEIKGYSNILHSYNKEVLKILETIDIFQESSEKFNTIKSSFSFPEELKVPCEQYLLYFAEFLRDLGINATSNLKEEAGKVLFSVTPTDDVEALDKIREALAVYLNFPSSPIEYNESFAAMRLHQQVDNLQHSQRMAEREIRSSERELRLAQTVIENQDKIILQKDTIIGQQNKVIEKITSKSIMMDSLENKAEFEKVFDGLEFGESKELKEKLGIKFKPVTFLQSLGRTISGSDDEITSLNLNEETDKNN